MEEVHLRDPHFLTLDEDCFLIKGRFKFRLEGKEIAFGVDHRCRVNDERDAAVGFNALAPQTMAGLGMPYGNATKVRDKAPLENSQIGRRGDRSWLAAGSDLLDRHQNRKAPDDRTPPHSGPNPVQRTPGQYLQIHRSSRAIAHSAPWIRTRKESLPAGE